MQEPLSLNELQALLGRAFSTSALSEWAVLLGCLLGVWHLATLGTGPAAKPAAKKPFWKMELGRKKGFYVVKEGFEKPMLGMYFKDTTGNLYDGGCWCARAGFLPEKPALA